MMVCGGHSIFLMMPLFQVKNVLSVLKTKKAQGEEAQSCLSLTNIRHCSSSQAPGVFGLPCGNYFYFFGMIFVHVQF